MGKKRKKRVQWSEEEIKILIDNYSKMGSTELSKTLLKSRPAPSINCKAKQLKLEYIHKYYEDLTGQTINGIYFIKYVGNNKENKAEWLCLCQCGKEFINLAKRVKNGSVKSCGCVLHETRIKTGKKLGKKYGKVYGTKEQAKLARLHNTIVKSDEQSFAHHYPELIEEWDYELNDKKPEEVKYASGQKAHWICKICKHKWKCRVTDRGMKGSNCPKCKINKGGQKVSQILDKLNIKYEIEKRFSDCKYKNTLPFDFYLTDLNICIEYNGQQHYNVVDFSSRNPKRAKEQFRLIQVRDQIKKDYCKNKDIKLIIIPYYEFDNIEKILKEEIVL